MTKDYSQTSNWTGRTPRTLAEAFGPYADGLTYQPQPRTPTGLAAVIITAAIIVLLLVLKA